MTDWHSPYCPNQYQNEIHYGMARHRFGVLVCHRRFGKTECSIGALTAAALSAQKPRSRFGYIAPYMTQATQIAWSTLKAHLRGLPGAVFSETLHQVTMPINGAVIRLYGADNPDALRGGYFDGVVIDEVADVKPELWAEVLRPALADRQGWALFIGTPKGINLFSELFEYAQRTKGWFHKVYRADETKLPWLPAKELELARDTMPGAAYRQEFLCDFTASSDNTLITIDLASAAAHRYGSVREPDLNGLARVLGVDVARFGSDRTVFFPRVGHVALDPIVMQGLDNMEVAGRLAVQIESFRPDAVFVDVGGGQGVIDRLRQLNYPVTSVNFGGSALRPIYANKRAEMWDMLRQWLTDGGAIPNLGELKTDLCAPTYSFDTSNRMLLERKERLRERGLRSPDLADALALTFAAPVKPAARTYAPGIIQKTHEDYSMAGW